MEIKVPISLFKPPSDAAMAVSEGEEVQLSHEQALMMQQSLVLPEYMLKVAVVVEEREAVMLIDTGASRSVFDKDFLSGFAELHSWQGLKTMGAADAKIESVMVRLGQFAIGELCMQNYLAAAIDLSHINQAFALSGEPPIAGLIGLDVLEAFKARIDLKNKCLRLSFAKKIYYKARR